MSAPTSVPAAAGPLADRDMEDWKTRANDVLARPSEHLNSKSPESAQPWLSSLFGCFMPIDTCLVTCCVPCVTFGKTHHRMRNGGNLGEYSPVNTSCLVLCGSGFVCLSPVVLAMQRAEIRAKYHLQGNCISDLLMSCCCGCCSLIQQDKEVAAREKGGAVEEQYHAPEGMTYPAKQ